MTKSVVPLEKARDDAIFGEAVREIIEWAIAGGHAYLFQCRAGTAG